MNKRVYILILLSLLVGNLFGQGGNLQREVTLYNDYRPSLGEARKYSFLPSVGDSVAIKQSVVYDINTKAFFPQYNFTPLPAAVIAPEERPKLYNSYLKVGFGTYMTPLAELSISNTISEKWAYGIYFGHLSSWGKVALDNKQKVFAGFMDNNAKIYGKRLFKKSVLEAAIDYSQMWRYSYGVYTGGGIVVEPAAEDILHKYQNVGANLKYSSVNTNRSDISYSAELYFYSFGDYTDLYQNSYGLIGEINKNIDGFDFGFNIEVDIDNRPDIAITKDRYLLNVNPYIGKQFAKWGIRAGASIDYTSSDNPNDDKTDFYIFPEAELNLKIWSSYIELIVNAGGEVKQNDPKDVVAVMPFLANAGLGVKNTIYKHNLSAGLRGLNGIGGNYWISASVSEIENMPFFDNVLFKPLIFDSMGIYPPAAQGRLFQTIYDDLTLFTLHGEMNGPIAKDISYNVVANYYYYDMVNMDFPIGRPDWDLRLNLSYNYRNKILTDMGFVAMGERIFGYDYLTSSSTSPLKYPPYAGLNLKVVYNYSPRISFWAKANNMTFGRDYYEYPFYPTQCNVIMGGITFSL